MSLVLLLIVHHKTEARKQIVESAFCVRGVCVCVTLVVKHFSLLNAARCATSRRQGRALSGLSSEAPRSPLTETLSHRHRAAHPVTTFNLNPDTSQLASAKRERQPACVSPAVRSHSAEKMSKDAEKKSEKIMDMESKVLWYPDSKRNTRMDTFRKQVNGRYGLNLGE